MAIVFAIITAKHVDIFDGSANSVVVMMMLLILMIWCCLLMDNVVFFFFLPYLLELYIFITMISPSGGQIF